MVNLSGRFRWLTHQFDALVEHPHESRSVEERKKVLKRMKILLDENDELIFSSLKRDKQDTASSPPLDQPTADS
jgi:hypothetical protein